jgi:hypothetical protein
LYAQGKSLPWAARPAGHTQRGPAWPGRAPRPAGHRRRGRDRLPPRHPGHPPHAPESAAVRRGNGAPSPATRSPARTPARLYPPSSRMNPRSLAHRGPPSHPRRHRSDTGGVQSPSLDLPSPGIMHLHIRHRPGEYGWVPDGRVIAGYHGHQHVCMIRSGCGSHVSVPPGSRPLTRVTRTSGR